jgi:hypothetical protein
MKKLTVTMLCLALIGSLAGTAGADGKYPQVPGKVAIYNETGKAVSLTIVGQESNLGIDPDRRLAYRFNPNAPVDLKFWYFADPKKREIGRVSASNGDVYVVTPGGIRTINTVPRAQKAMAGPEPDFTNASAVIADLERMKREGQAKKANLVVVKCNYAINVINNFMRLNPGGDPSILKQRWQEAYNEYKKMH